MGCGASKQAAADAKEAAAPAVAAPVAKQAVRAIIAGAPASGKGTQCELIVAKCGVVHISTGDLLRAEVAAASPSGLKAKEFMDRGDLVPDEVVIEMVKSRLAQADAQAQGWLLDGFPRTAAQAEALTAAGITPQLFLLLDVPDEVLIERVVGRRCDPTDGKIYHVKFNPAPTPEVEARCTVRSDDTEEKARNRLEVFGANVEAVKGQYEACLSRVDGNRDKAAVFADIEAAIDKVTKA